MPLPPWIALLSPSRAARAWVGVHAQAGQFALARLDPARQGRRPRVLACQSVAGQGGLAPLRAWWRAQAQRGDRAALVLGAGDYQMLQIPAPAVAADELRSAARWQIKDLIDYSVDDAAIDCYATPDDGRAAAAARLNVVVARQALVADSVAAWRAAGLRLQAIDIPEMALRNLALLAAGESACAFLHVGIDETRLLLLWREELCVSRQLPLAARQLQQAGHAQEQVERLALEIQRSVDAFGRQFSAAPLTQLWVSSVQGVAALADALAAQISLQVQPFMAEDWIDFEAGALPFDAQADVDHSLAIGVALRDGSAP